MQLRYKIKDFPRGIGSKCVTKDYFFPAWMKRQTRFPQRNKNRSSDKCSVANDYCMQPGGNKVFPPARWNRHDALAINLRRTTFYYLPSRETLLSNGRKI